MLASCGFVERMCEQLLTANNILVSNLPLSLYQGLKALALYVMSLRFAEGIHGTQIAQNMDYRRSVWTTTIKIKSQKGLCPLSEM
jgi:hypothetical protein